MSIQALIGIYPCTVTEDMANTFRELKRSRSIVYAEHKVVSGLPKLEHTGRELDTMSLQILLHPMIADALSVDARILALRTLALTGIQIPVVIGFGWYGMNVIKSVEVAHKIMHNGSTWSATVDLTLQEYN